MLAKPRQPRVYRRGGAPDLWHALDAPRRTFASDSGDVADLMGVTPAGIRGQGVTWAAGPLGACLDGGGGKGITFAFPVVGNTLTVSLRFLLRSKVQYGGLINSRDSGFVGLLISGDLSLPLGSSWNNSSSEYAGTTGLTLALGRWYYAAVVFSPTNTTTYLGDVAAGSLPSYTLPGTNPSRTLTHWTVGDDPGGGGRGLDGCWDDLRIYRRSLSPAGVAREFADPFWRCRPPRREEAAQTGPASSFCPWFLRPSLVLGSGVF